LTREAECETARIRRVITTIAFVTLLFAACGEQREDVADLVPVR
jgi:hypothetical protein